MKTAARAVEAIRDEFQNHPRFVLELDVASTRSLVESSVMVSDWSGAALDYALGLERPVLFVDLPRKVNNPEYASLGVEPLEVRIREELGRVLAPEELARMPEVIFELLQQVDAYPGRLAELREQHIYHVGKSGPEGARALKELLEKL
jgi:YidC/Oxa1 family membrane protein insertase